MFTLGAISCRDQTSDMQTSLWEAFQHSGLVVVTLRGHTVTGLSLTLYSLIATAFIVLGCQHHGWLEHLSRRDPSWKYSSFSFKFNASSRVGVNQELTFCLFIVVQSLSACVDEFFKHDSRFFSASYGEKNIKGGLNCAPSSPVLDLQEYSLQVPMAE